MGLSFKDFSAKITGKVEGPDGKYYKKLDGAETKKAERILSIFERFIKTESAIPEEGKAAYLECLAQCHPARNPSMLMQIRTTPNFPPEDIFLDRISLYMRNAGPDKSHPIEARVPYLRTFGVILGAGRGKRFREAFGSGASDDELVAIMQDIDVQEKIRYDEFQADNRKYDGAFDAAYPVNARGNYDIPKDGAYAVVEVGGKAKVYKVNPDFSQSVIGDWKDYDPTYMVSLGLISIDACTHEAKKQRQSMN